MNIRRRIEKYYLQNKPEIWLTQAYLMVPILMFFLFLELVIALNIPLVLYLSNYYFISLILIVIPVLLGLRSQYLRFIPHFNVQEIYNVYYLNSLWCLTLLIVVFLLPTIVFLRCHVISYSAAKEDYIQLANAVNTVIRSRGLTLDVINNKNVGASYAFIDQMKQKYGYEVKFNYASRNYLYSQFLDFQQNQNILNLVTKGVIGIFLSLSIAAYSVIIVLTKTFTTFFAPINTFIACVILKLTIKGVAELAAWDNNNFPKDLEAALIIAIILVIFYRNLNHILLHYILSGSLALLYFLINPFFYAGPDNVYVSLSILVLFLIYYLLLKRFVFLFNFYLYRPVG